MSVLFSLLAGNDREDHGGVGGSSTEAGGLDIVLW